MFLSQKLYKLYRNSQVKFILIAFEISFTDGGKANNAERRVKDFDDHRQINTEHST